MKPILLLLTVFSLSSVASESLSLSKVTESLSSDQITDVQNLLAEAASKAMYVSNLCDKPIDPEKFKELAKIKAFSEGYETIEGISWDSVKDTATKGYDELTKQAPEGQLCEQYLADLKGKYRFLKSTDTK